MHCIEHRQNPEWRQSSIGGVSEKNLSLRKMAEKNTFEWPKVVSEVIFCRFWGVICIEKCFRNLEIVIESAVVKEESKHIPGKEHKVHGFDILPQLMVYQQKTVLM